LRRAVLTLSGTFAGLAVLLAVKFHPSAASAPTAGTLTPPSAGAASTGTAMPPATGPSATKPATGKPAASGMPTSSTGTGGTGNGGTGQSTATRTFTGSVDNTSYGPMQVQATVAGKVITKITVLQQTNSGSQSQQIDAMAIPQLTKEALAAQSAKINAVSGASYTSQGYIQSLQSALDQAGI
jgi:uncharacterized protein with FMN-binding domain